MATKQTYTYGLPANAVPVTVALDPKLEMALSMAAHSNNWFETHFYRYLLSLGWEHFKAHQVQEHEVGVEYSKDDLQEKI